jgi:fructose-1-phosphate kinase PfkB-like protein
VSTNRSSSASCSYPGNDAESAVCAGNTRVGTIMRERDGRLSVVNEPGVRIGAKEWEEFRRLIVTGLSSHDVLLCMGRIPPGAALDGYARFAREARHLGARCVVDASGETLAATIEAREAVGGAKPR